MDTTLSFSRLLGISILLFARSAADASDVGQSIATRSVGRIRAGLRSTAGRIESLSASYRSYDYNNGTSPERTYVHKILAAKSPCSLFIHSGHGYNGMDWHDDPLQQASYITARHMYTAYPLKRAYFERDINPRDALPGTLPEEFLFLATGIWPLVGRPAPRPFGRPYMLREIAESGDYSLRPLLEQVDGRWCHVLESPGRDRLWLDGSRGCSLLARELLSGRDSSLARRWELSQHIQVAPEVWFPRRIRIIAYDHNAPSVDGRKRTLLDATHIVLDAKVNQVSDDVFAFRPRPGSVLLLGGETRQVTAGGFDYLDDIARWVQVHSPPSWPVDRKPDWLAYLLPLLAGAIVLACELLRRRAACVHKGNGSPGLEDAKD